MNQETNKIFGIGLSRTGTTSLHELMKNLGFKSIHLPHSMAQIDEYTFANDTPVSARFEKLDARYPNSKFIYTTREPENWILSCLKWVHQNSRSKFFSELPSDDVCQWISDGDLNLYGRDYHAMVGITKGELLAAYKKHDSRVHAYFQNRPNDLLVVDVTNASSRPFTKIVTFLEENGLLKIPEANSSQQYITSFKSEKGVKSSTSQITEQQVAAQYKMANTWLQLGKTVQAEKSYHKIIELKPDSKAAYLQLSRLLLSAQRIDEATEILRQGVEANPNVEEIHKKFINALEQAGKIQETFAHYDLIQKTKKIDIMPDDIICCVVARNEAHRLPYFLNYHRKKGVHKFLVIDNNSSDNTLEILKNEPDVFIWQSGLSFNKANFGSVWFELLLRTYGKGHWCLILDADELLIYPDSEEKSLPQLCRELDENRKTALSAVLLDMYSDKPVKDTLYKSGQNFLEVCPCFDRKFYHIKYEKSGPYKNQTYYFGGVRQRVFGNTGAYLLSKIPLLKYDSNFILAGGQHWTNRPESEIADITGCLLHFKFFASFIDYAKQEAVRKEHYDCAIQYQEYLQGVTKNENLMLYSNSHSVKFRGSRQLVELGIMQKSKQDLMTARYTEALFPPIKPVSANVPRPFWSVMLTVFKRTQYLERALKSVLEQAASPEEMQIKIIQDGNDTTVRRQVEELVKKVGSNRVSFHQTGEQYGHPHIFNFCIEQAHGHWVHILHDDDWVKQGFYKALQKGIWTEPKIGAAFCRQIHLKNFGRENWVSWLERETPGIIPNWLERIAVMCRLQFSSIVVKREAYEKVGGFYTGAKSAFDWDMWKRIALFYPIWFEPEVLACSSKDGQAETDYLVKSGQQVADTLAAIELANTYLPENSAAGLTRKAKANYARYALDIAKKQLQIQDHKAAIANFQQALNCDSSDDVRQILTSILKL